MNFRKFLEDLFPRVFRGRAFMVVGDKLNRENISLEAGRIYWEKEYPLSGFSKIEIMVLLNKGWLVEVKPR